MTKFSLEMDLLLRRQKLCQLMQEGSVDAMMITGNANLAYIAGRVFDGYYYLDCSGNYFEFVKAGECEGNAHSISISRPSMIPQILGTMDVPVPMPECVALEEEEIGAKEYQKLCKLFNCKVVSATALMRTARSVKTPYEVELYRRDCALHDKMYAALPSLYMPGMSELDLSAEFECLLRKAGHMGVFRTFGNRMEGHFGTLFSGDNGSYPTPYDMALGGKGVSPLFPLGASFDEIGRQSTVMVDLTGNYSGYLVEISRVFGVGKLPKVVHDLHGISLEIQDHIMAMAKPGVLCSELYEAAQQIITKYGAEECFMGTKKQAKFIGHGIGLEINELPVIMGKYKKPLEKNMIFALEPKLIYKGIGAVGTENTYLVTDSGLERLTNCPQEIITLAE